MAVNGRLGATKGMASGLMSAWLGWATGGPDAGAGPGSDPVKETDRARRPLGDERVALRRRADSCLDPSWWRSGDVVRTQWPMRPLQEEAAV